MRHVKFIAVLLFGGCSFFSEEISVTVRLPDTPLHWESSFSPLSYRVEHPDATGEITTGEVERDRENIKIELPKGLISPVVFRPILPGFEAVPFCAGALYPVPGMGGVSGRNEIVATWEDGMACELLLELYEAGFPLDALNCVRFLTEVRERGGPHSWYLDKTGIKESLGRGGFSLLLLRTPEVLPVSAAIPEGTWYRLNPLRETAIVFETGGKIPCFRNGMNFFFEPSLKLRADIAVSDNDEGVSLIQPLMIDR